MDTIYLNLVLKTLENAVCLEPIEDWGGGHIKKEHNITITQEYLKIFSPVKKEFFFSSSCLKHSTVRLHL